MANHCQRGYIRVFRSVFDDDDAFWSEERERSNWEAWLYVLHRTHWQAEPGEIKVRGSVVPIYRGEVYLSRRTLAKALNWTERRARTFLNLARKLARIVPTNRAHYGIYKVINYETYNPLWGTESQRPEPEHAHQNDPQSGPPIEKRALISERKTKSHSVGTVSCGVSGPAPQDAMED